jgi:signal transduction histidine kinase
VAADADDANLTSERTGRHGRGLGLYLAKLVAKAHQGAMSVEPRVGGGTLFRLRLGAA